MSKYVRHQPVVSRQADSGIDEDHWLKQFQRKLEKGAVQPRSIDNSLFDQINSIMNNKAKHPSVEAAVEDMKERSGLTAYLDKVKQSEEQTNNTKVATADTNAVIDKKVNMTPIVFSKYPAIQNTLENYIRDTKGNLPVPAIIEKIKSIHKSDVSEDKDWDDDNLIRLVSRLNLEAKKNNPSSYDNYSNLGSRDSASNSEVDPSNTDAFHALNPAKN